MMILLYIKYFDIRIYIMSVTCMIYYVHNHDNGFPSFTKVCNCKKILPLIFKFQLNDFGVFGARIVLYMYSI